MPRRRLGDGVILTGIGEVGALGYQPAEPTGPLGGPAGELVGPELVDRQEDDQTRDGSRCRDGGRQEGERQQGHSGRAESKSHCRQACQSEEKGRFRVWRRASDRPLRHYDLGLVRYR